MDVPAAVCAEAVPETMHRHMKNKKTIRAKKTALPVSRFLLDIAVLLILNLFFQSLLVSSVSFFLLANHCPSALVRAPGSLLSSVLSRSCSPHPGSLRASSAMSDILNMEFVVQPSSRQRRAPFVLAARPSSSGHLCWPSPARVRRFPAGIPSLWVQGGWR